VKIFISHSSIDKWVARQISRLLEADGHTTFLDEKDIKSGESIDSAIQVHLKDSDHVLLLLSPASVKSQWVLIELGGAKALGKHIVPVLYHVGSNEIPQAISNLLARDINDLDKYFDELKKLQVAATKSPEAVAIVAAKTEASAKKALKTTHKTMGGFRVGQKVRVAQVEHLTPEDKDLWPKWVTSLDKYSGTIAEITAFSPNGGAYLDITGDKFKWNLRWLSKAVLRAFNQRRGSTAWCARMTANPSIEGMPKRLRLLRTPHVKR
jgi:TIR domain